MDIELARAAAYEQLKMLFEKYSFDKKCFPSIYARDWRLCYEVLQKEGGQLYDLVGMPQKQAAKLLYVLLEVESTLEVYGVNSEVYKSSLLDVEKEFNALKSILNEKESIVSRHMSETVVEMKDGRRARQIGIIIDVLKELKFDIKDIPIPSDGCEKKDIFKLCKGKDGRLFSSRNCFDNAWSEASKRGLIRIHNKESYIGKPIEG